MDSKSPQVTKGESNLSKTQGFIKSELTTKSPAKEKPIRECKNVKERISFLHVTVNAGIYITGQCRCQ